MRFDSAEEISVFWVDLLVKSNGLVDEGGVCRRLEHCSIVGFEFVVLNREIETEFLIVCGEPFDLVLGFTGVRGLETFVQFLGNVYQNTFACEVGEFLQGPVVFGLRDPDETRNVDGRAVNVRRVVSNCGGGFALVRIEFLREGVGN